MEDLSASSAKNETASAEKGSKVSVIAAICGNVGVAVVKFIASALSGSSALFSEAIHSVVDCGNGLLILLGLRKAKKAPDYSHPFGSGKELYFYTLIVSLAIFLLGGVFAIMEGINAIRAALAGQSTLGDPLVGYIVIVAAAIIEGSSLTVALKNFNVARGSMKPLEFIRAAKDPSLYTVVLEDSAAEIGLLFALLGNVLSQATGNPLFDAAASVFIGALLCCVAVLMMTETKGLLVGEGVTPEEVDEIQALAEADARVRECGSVLTLYMGPTSLLVVMDISLMPTVIPAEVDAITDGIESRIKARFPEATQVYIEEESLSVCLQELREQDAWEE